MMGVPLITSNPESKKPYSSPRSFVPQSLVPSRGFFIVPPANAADGFVLRSLSERHQDRLPAFLKRASCREVGPTDCRRGIRRAAHHNGRFPLAGLCNSDRPCCARRVPHFFKARSSSLRTASGRVGASDCFLIQASSFASCFGCKRTWTCVPLPVGGRPLFRGTIISCLMGALSGTIK